MNIVEELHAELSREAAATRRLLERVPEPHFSWRPHAKSDSLGTLANHIALLPLGIARLLSEPVTELPDVPRPEASSVAQLLSTLDESVAFAKAKIGEWGEDGLSAAWKLTAGGRTILDVRRFDMLRSTMLNHWYHHRGQLTVYLRLLDVSLPATYGPSADENPFG
jgi:uncharacterized damage-inducible protein DinB